MPPLKFGIIGAGGIARLMHLPQLAALGDAVEVKVVQGRTASRLKRLCAEYRIPRWTHAMDEVLSDPDLDAIIVATPHPLHVKPGIAALEAGKHLLVQKPLCGDLAEADAFVAAAERTDRIVFVLPHAEPALVACRRLIRAGAIGAVSGGYARTSHGGPEVYYAQVREAFGEPEGDLWFFDATKASVGALFDMGVYAVAGLVAVLGTVRRVTGLVRTVAKPTTLEDTATLLLEFESGVIATAETGWCDPVCTWRFEFRGTAGSLTAPGEGGANLTRWEPGSYVQEGVPPIPHPVDVSSDDLGTAHAHFVACVRTRTPPPFSHARAARHVTEVLLAGLESARTGRPVEVRSKAEPAA
jgi:predicted dehydrogenase